MSWPDILQWLIAGGLGAGGFKLADLFFIKRPKSDIETGKVIRDELRIELNHLKETVACQAAKIDALEEQFHRYKLDVIAKLMEYGVAKEVIEEVIKL